MSGSDAVIEALEAEAALVDALVADLDDTAWQVGTPAPGWTVAHQIGHLAFVFSIAGMAASAPEAFRATTGRITDFDAAVNAATEQYVALPPDALLARWRGERDAAIDALSTVPADQLVPWLVNDLPPGVLACAGMMELFAHGQDVADALGTSVPRTDRVAWLAGFVARTRDFGYLARGLEPPAEEFRFELTLPSGAPIVLGPEHTDQVVRGPAVDLCLLATRRRHPADLRIEARGDAASGWLDVAQAYRGPAGPGRRPGAAAVRPAA